MKTIATAVIFFLILGSALTVQSQTLEEVLDKHFKAVGQDEMVEKDAYMISARINQMGMDLPMVMKVKRPDKFRVEMEMQGQKMIQVYNGKEGWLLAPWLSSEPQVLEGAQLEQAMEQTDINGELYNYREKGSSADLIGKVMVDDNEVYRIKLTTKNGDVKNYYLDADTYLVDRVKGKVKAQGQEVEVQQNMSDYKQVDGIMVAHRIESSSPMGTANIIIEKVDFNPEFADDIFNKPGK